MINSNRLTIIPSDGAVYFDEIVHLDLNLSDCGIPANVHALQWLDGKGHIEIDEIFTPNQHITELPQWALNCSAKDPPV